MSDTPPSLVLSLGDDAVTARLSAAPGHESDLQRLIFRFRSARQRAAGTAEVSVEDLLGNLAELASWPRPDSVAWDRHLAALARDVTSDAQAVGDRLTDEPRSHAIIADDDVPALLGPNWIGPLTSFQSRDIAKLLSLRHGANFSVPGAGKTRVALGVFEALRQQGVVARLLIVGPKSAYEAWLSENAMSFANPLRLRVFGPTIDRTAGALIINYERLQGMLPAVARWLAAQPSMLILDEAHRMKLGSDGVFGAACMALGPRARRRLILTGTPAPNGAKDLENLMGFVWPGHGRRAVTQAVAGGSLPHASRVLRPLFTRTTKRELELPPVDLKVRQLDLPPLHREIYDALIGVYSVRASAASSDFDAFGRILAYMLMGAISPALLALGTTRYEPLAYRVPPLPIPDDSSLLTLMRDLPSHEMSPKYQETLAIVASNASAGRKTLVWSTFIRSLTTLEQILSEFSPAMVFGGTHDREMQISRFRDDPKCRVLLSNPATLGEGISLHHDCHDAVYVDRDFAAGKFLQSLDRIHRLGLDPDTETRITVLTSRETIDEIVNERLEKKLRFMGEILDDPAVRQLADLDEDFEIGSHLNSDDLQALMGHLRANPS